MSSDPTPFGECPVPVSDAKEILLGHGSGGKLTARLIEKIILPAFRNPALDRLDDSAILPFGGERLAFTTDSYVVTPIFFPGGDIGELAVNGTINDLAMGGARPLYLSLAFILEEGLPIADLERVIDSVRRAASRAGVEVVTGDTKVVGRGSGDKVFINTSGIGMVPRGIELSSARVQPGDAILLSGPVGDHGVAILSRREGLEFDGQIESDTAPLHELVAAALAADPRVHALRDPTRGGVAATLVEIATRRGLGIEVDETAVPVRDAVRGACEILGLDPLLVANEGKLVAFVPETASDRVLRALRAHPLGKEACRIGRVTSDHPGFVTLRTPIGGQRILDLPFGESLPRIC
jgi:hydrogenase expression/formation protein HypE